jgi:2TM domain
MTINASTTDTRDDTVRDRALRRLKKRRDFHAHLLVYAMVNAAIVTVWFVATPGGFFWPVFPMLGWGIGLVMNAWDVYHAEDFTDEEIEREIARLRSR